MLVFVANGGNMDLTAKALFQHKNTIRYRINKISTLLDIDNDMELYHELYLFSRIHEARKYLNMFFKD
ncbi:MAG: PucR family transcriptional regulator [Firmicutes bacterium]|nr:PucR family transcriptional regulator [Bacillota bacterium]